jgi:nucleoside-diphosphate-sugar epimerase
MRVFLTGATGFIGSAVIPDLKKGGHEVLGLARSDAGAKALLAAGASVHRGDLEDLESLRSGAAKSEAVIHCGFIHDFSKFVENCQIDARAIEAMGAVLAGSNRPFIVTSGTGTSGKPGVPATELTPASEHMPRRSEQALAPFTAQGVRTMVARMPQVHDTEKHGLITYLIDFARQKGVSAYVGDGQNRWPAAPRFAAAELYRLVLEKGKTGGVYNAIAEEGISLKDIAEAVGKRVKVPVKSLSPDEAAGHFGWLAGFAGWDLTASSAQTQQELGWHPTGPGMIEDILAGN